MKKDPFESLLASTPRREIPDEWRAEILREATRLHLGERVDEGSRSWWAGCVATLLWPHPRAWAALATVWLIILGLNLAKPEVSELRMDLVDHSPGNEERLAAQIQYISLRNRLLTNLEDHKSLEKLPPL